MSTFQEKIQQAKAAGYSDDEINSFVQSKIEKAKQAGYSDQEIQQYLGNAVPQQPQQDSALKTAGKVALGVMYPPYGMQQMGKMIQKGADAAGQGVAENLAQNGVNPNVAAGAGTAVQMVPEAVKAFAGMGAGTGVKAAAEGIEAAGPLSAAIKDPSIIMPGTVGKATKALQMAKEAAKEGLTTEASARLRLMLDRNPTKLANEAIESIKDGAPIHPGQGVYYRAALNAMKNKGGELASDAYKYLPKLDSLMRKSSPDLMNKVGEVAKLGRADLLDDKAFPWLTTLVAGNASPALAALRIAATSGGQRAIGAGIGSAAQLAPLAVGGSVPFAQSVQNNAIEALDRIYKARQRHKKGA